jgi:hypothetical protein
MLAGWIFKAGDFIEGLMVQLKDYRIGNRLHFCIVDNPSKLANLSRYLKANLVPMAVETMTFVLHGDFREPMGAVD